MRTPDGAGGYTEAWTDVPQWSAIFAEIEPLKGDEQIRGMQTTATATHRIRLWAAEGVKSIEHRVRRHRDGAIMQIVAPPAYDAMRMTMELLVRDTEAAS